MDILWYFHIDFIGVYTLLVYYDYYKQLWQEISTKNIYKTIKSMPLSICYRYEC